MDTTTTGSDLGPLSIFLCWQSGVLALLIAILTHGVKALIDYKLGGKDARQERMFFNSLVLPATPILLGAVAGMFIPLWPDVLGDYLKAHALVGWHAKMVLAAYGAVVGQFSSYVWDRYSSIAEGMKAKAEAAQAPAAPAAVPPPPAIPPVTPAAPADPTIPPKP